MTNVFDVADYILSKKPNISTKQLQKLIYYSQAWSLASNDEPIFSDDFQAWRGGPMCYGLYLTHKGKYFPDINNIKNRVTNTLTDKNIGVIDYVIKTYGIFTGDRLGDMTHLETPWLTARGNLPVNANSNEVIPKDSISCFFKNEIEFEKPYLKIIADRKEEMANGEEHIPYTPSYTTNEYDDLPLDELIEL